MLHGAGTLSLATETVEPNDYGDPRVEYAAARETAALFDLSNRTHIELTGRDRGRFLHNFCTNDIRGLAAGKASEAFLTNVQGKVVAFVSVYATDEALWLTSVPGSAERIIAHLSRYLISEDVTLTDRTAELSALLVAGPDAPQIVARVLPAAATLGASPSLDPANPLHAIQVRRHDILRLPGFILVGPLTEIRAMRERLIAAGATPAGRAAFEALRIEAGFPLYGVDITDANLAQEASRTAQAISFTKGCYLGQEPIARIDALGHVNQQLRGVRIEGEPIPPPGTELFDPADKTKKVGRVTSSARSYADNRPVALAYIRRGHEAPGTPVVVSVSNALLPATIFWPEN